MHFFVPLPIIMFFIVSSLLIFCLAISVIFYNACVEVVIPLLKNSRAYRRFITRISYAIYSLFLEIRNDAFFHLGIICESDGDEEEIGFDYDYQFKTYQDCELVKSPPKEEVVPDPNNNINPTGRTARRRRVPVPPVPIAPPVNRRPVIRLAANIENLRAHPPVRMVDVVEVEDHLRELVEF